jgi:hypothetical protein
LEVLLSFVLNISCLCFFTKCADYFNPRIDYHKSLVDDANTLMDKIWEEYGEIKKYGEIHLNTDHNGKLIFEENVNDLQ